MPAIEPVTAPVVALTVTISGTPADHDPPGVALVSVTGTPGQLAAVPAIAAGNGFTVTVLSTVHPVPMA